MRGSKYRMTLDLTAILLVIVFLFSGYTFTLQKNYSDSIVENAQNRDTECSDAIRTLVSNKFTRDDFKSINTIEDMQTARYQELQQMLNELRTLNSTRYLYTASRNADGRLIYLVDGLDLDASDFAYPGTYIEDEMIPYIDAALSGQTIYSQDIVDTTWGHIFTACYPVIASDGTGDVIGALCIEIDMESTYAFVAESQKKTMRIAINAAVVIFVLTIIGGLVFRKQRKEEASQQQRLREAVVAADAANEAKSTFLFNMSHDIRTPMNAILGFAEIGRKNLDDPRKTEECFDKIQISGEKMLSILDNVLELSRIESGKTVVEESAIEAGSVLEACVTMIQPEMEKKHLQFSVSKSIIHPYVYMDTTLITEIILNIISNSIKYTAEGGSVTCAIRQLDDREDGRFTQEFVVRDTGIGMSKEFQEHIFEAFSRERNSTTSGVEGTGLGMGIVKKLVDMLGGTITVDSTIGVGSAFVIKFPCRIAKLEDTQPKQIAVDNDNTSLNGKHILLAEDNDLNAEIAITLLSEHGLKIDRAENGVVCAEMLENAPDGYYSLILMDIQMPILDGYETTRKIRHFANESKANIPIIAMTANAFAEDRQKALDVGMNDHIAKPIDMSKLIPVLLKYV
ncbi:MAG: ATP-binding protein [Agathobacter sp.]|nr:ATP-binding protein [Agathobacter sp.]